MLKKYLTLATIGLLFAISCSNENEERALPNANDEMPFIFNVETCHYELSEDFESVISKSTFSKEEVMEILNRNNAFIDSVLFSNINIGNGMAFVTEGSSNKTLRIWLNNNGNISSEQVLVDSMNYVPDTDSVDFIDNGYPDSLGIDLPTVEPPHGKLYNGGSDMVFAPTFMRGFDCDCFGHSVLVVHTVSTVFLDGYPKVGICSGLAAHVFVAIAASNYSGTITYKSTDSNQSFCFYVGKLASGQGN